MESHEAIYGNALNRKFRPLELLLFYHIDNKYPAVGLTNTKTSSM